MNILCHIHFSDEICSMRKQTQMIEYKDKIGGLWLQLLLSICMFSCAGGTSSEEEREGGVSGGEISGGVRGGESGGEGVGCSAPTSVFLFSLK